jgi:hypothetical protein
MISWGGIRLTLLSDSPPARGWKWNGGFEQRVVTIPPLARGTALTECGVEICSPRSLSTVRCRDTSRLKSSSHMSSEWRALDVTSYTVQKVVQFTHLRSGTTSNLAEVDVIQSQEHNLLPWFSYRSKKM